MKTKSKFALVLIIVFSAFQSSKAKGRIIRGSVSTFKCIALIGATIEVKSTGQKVLSDSIGFFEAETADKDKIIVSANGFKTSKHKISVKENFIEVDLKIKQSESAIDEAVSNGHIKQREKLISVIELNNKELDFSRYNTLYEVISGRFPNVEIQGNGDIIIRGKNSLAQSNAALIVIDGVVTDNSALDNVSPTNVKSINILKGTEAARYGSRGANGVVAVKTLRGHD